MITIHPEAEKMMKEPSFEIFKHEGFLCCIQRMNWSGNINGYVAVTKDHPLFGKNYLDKIQLKESPLFNGNYIGLLCATLGDDEENVYSINMALNVHGGITYSQSELNGIENDLFGELWWFGFDTSHSGDLKPYQNDIDRKYQHEGDEYKDFEYVKEQTQQLANQLKSWNQLTK